MQVTLHLDLADNIAKTLLQQSNPEQFAQKLIQAALEPFSANENNKTDWKSFFDDSQHPSDDFMQERIDIPPQARELFDNYE